MRTSHNWRHWSYFSKFSNFLWSLKHFFITKSLKHFTVLFQQFCHFRHLFSFCWRHQRYQIWHLKKKVTKISHENTNFSPGLLKRFRKLYFTKNLRVECIFFQWHLFPLIKTDLLTYELNDHELNSHLFVAKPGVHYCLVLFLSNWSVFPQYSKDFNINPLGGQRRTEQYVQSCFGLKITKNVHCEQPKIGKNK